MNRTGVVCRCCASPAARSAANRPSTTTPCEPASARGSAYATADAPAWPTRPPGPRWPRSTRTASLPNHRDPRVPLGHQRDHLVAGHLLRGRYPEIKLSSRRSGRDRQARAVTNPYPIVTEHALPTRAEFLTSRLDRAGADVFAARETRISNFTQRCTVRRVPVVTSNYTLD